ncbi:Ca2+-binding RTX toxin-like protein [Rhizobium azooxidifex]|uniref:Ca2+-binding RTX toxin-like protein n=1 Tax=Mycoplana azooxidifex TaxID=1636188 RepID=A0A7W6GJP1_9HYPH|nr:hypothetical protein [Mycoplana azooxidifex]MBB3976099.1 Ca2+-binding RTX toxin-like protein [Mycoplana azooxidifex]
MAKGTWYSSLGDYGLFEDKWFGELRAHSHSSTKVTMVASNGVKLSIVGTGLKVNSDGEPVSGTIKSITFLTRSGDKLNEFTGLNVKASEMHQSTANFGWEGMRILVLKGDDTLTGSSKSDTLYGYGGHDTLKGGNGHDRVYGYDGNDKLNGDAGDDWLIGGNGTDTLKGGTGNDMLNGGMSRDTLTGGSGADLFLFVVPEESTVGKAGRDIITDFSRSQRDKIQLDVMDADVKKSGDQDFTFIGTKAFTAAGQIRYEKIGGDTIVYGNIDSDKTAEFAFVLDLSISLKASDFIL